jgi:uncharacterized membrane protein YkoI
MTTTTNSRQVSKKVLMYGAILVAAVTLLTAAVSSEVLAQGNTAGSKNTTSSPAATTSAKQGNIPNAPSNITGSIPIGSTIKGAISSKVKTSLSEAITTAQKAVGSNSSATLAFIRTLNGYLVYDIHIRNNSNNTPYAVIVDAGNGKVLLKQALPLSSFAMGPPGPMVGKWRAGHEGGYYGHGMGMMGPRQGTGMMGPHRML